MSCGLALAAVIDARPHKIYCILGDGECQEGSVWEAALFAAHHQLDNLVVVIDGNGHQSSGDTDAIVSLFPLQAKWQAFGWHVQEIDGHSFSDLEKGFFSLPYSSLPHVIIARTQKGKGVSFTETDNKWHTTVPSDAELSQAKRELGLL